MSNWNAEQDDRCDSVNKACSQETDYESVAETCRILGIRTLHRLNFQSSYWQRVFEPCARAYASGSQTPNPDLLCNREIKFGELWRWAVGQNGADYLATGHYARIVDGMLFQARDLSKDQTYFLASVPRVALQSTLFPVGALNKRSEVQGSLLTEAGLNHLRDRKESMGLCFVGQQGKFSGFMSAFLDAAPQMGAVIEHDTGRPLGRHCGAALYTVGQKVPLAEGIGKRLYVCRKDAGTNTLHVVTSREHPALYCSRLRIFPVNWLAPLPSALEACTVYCSIRSSDKEGVLVKAVTHGHDSSLVVELEAPVFAASSGQWAVFYAEHAQGRYCVGGGPMVLD